MQSKIENLKAREILDSRGEPTVEVQLITNVGDFFSSVPSGSSKGKYEAVEIRDGGKRYHGRGVGKAVRNVNEIIFPQLKGKDVRDQKTIDEILIQLDGTKNKSKLGANAILPVSIATCRAGAAAENLPLYKYIQKIFQPRYPPKARLARGGKIQATPKESKHPTGQARYKLPIPCFNIINGGVHAGNELALQEFMIVPQFKSIKKSLQAASEIYHTLKKILIKHFGRKSVNVGDEGGFAPPLSYTKEALSLLMAAIKEAGYNQKVQVGLDVAGSQIFEKGVYKLDKTIFIRAGLIIFYQDLIKKYPIVFIEDPFFEEDWVGFQEITQKLGKKITIFGDDLLATNTERIKTAQNKKACNGLILKPNQIGTVTETIEAAKLSRSFGWKIMVSHRSGETRDDFIADLAVGISADFIKAGAPARGERLAKYNRLVRIEEEL